VSLLEPQFCFGDQVSGGKEMLHEPEVLVSELILQPRWVHDACCTPTRVRKQDPGCRNQTISEPFSFKFWSSGRFLLAE
jgi:hypothetical protein